jgi:hypothetical protein
VRAIRATRDTKWSGLAKLDHHLGPNSRFPA